MQYFFVYLLIIIINIVAVLAVLRVRRNRQNDPNVITDVKDSDIVYESDSPQQEKRPGFSSRFSRNSNLSLGCLLYTSPSPRDGLLSRMPSSA